MGHSIYGIHLIQLIVRDLLPWLASTSGAQKIDLGYVISHPQCLLTCQNKHVFVEVKVHVVIWEDLRVRKVYSVYFGTIEDLNNGI